jgi:glucose/arabinose dehydrogenase
MVLRRVLLVALLSSLGLFTILLTDTIAPQATAVDPAKAQATEATPFRVPPGFIVEKVAGPPLVEHPVMAGFDDRGRLFVAESAGLNLKAEQLLKELPDKIKLLEDTKGTGTFDKATVFADKMTFPMGARWYDGALYACSPPSLWKLEDTTGKGVADKRTELVTKFGFIGNAADIHGPFLGPDGRLYWTDGRHGHEIKRDERVMKGKAARIFRCRPDGRDVEVVCGGGMDDPVGMAFTPEGEAFATVDIYIGQPRRIDAIIHCVDGGVFPYHPVLQEFKRTGPLLPPVADLGWVAPSGMMRYRSGGELHDNLFVALFNTHAVQRHILERSGATFQTKAERTSWYRPVPISIRPTCWKTPTAACW